MFSHTKLVAAGAVIALTVTSAGTIQNAQATGTISDRSAAVATQDLASNALTTQGATNAGAEAGPVPLQADLAGLGFDSAGAQALGENLAQRVTPALLDATQAYSGPLAAENDGLMPYKLDLTLGQLLAKRTVRFIEDSKEDLTKDLIDSLWGPLWKQLRTVIPNDNWTDDATDAIVEKIKPLIKDGLDKGATLAGQKVQELVDNAVNNSDFPAASTLAKLAASLLSPYLDPDSQGTEQLSRDVFARSLSGVVDELYAPDHPVFAGQLNYSLGGVVSEYITKLLKDNKETILKLATEKIKEEARKVIEEKVKWLNDETIDKVLSLLNEPLRETFDNLSPKVGPTIGKRIDEDIDKSSLPGAKSLSKIAAAIVADKTGVSGPTVTEAIKDVLHDAVQHIVDQIRDFVDKIMGKGTNPAGGNGDAADHESGQPEKMFLNGTLRQV